MSNLERAIRLAAEAHQGQTDKAGMPYILHPLRVMFGMQAEAEMMTAVLHDVIEDTEWTLDTLREEGFPEQVLKALDLLTRRDEESYEAFIDRVKDNPIARRVKLADLEDNMDIKRISSLTERDGKRLAKYHRAWSILTNP